MKNHNYVYTDNDIHYGNAIIMYTNHDHERLNGVCLLCFESTGADWKYWCTPCYQEVKV